MASKLGEALMNIASNPIAGMALNTVAPGAGTAMNTVAGGLKAAGVGGEGNSGGGAMGNALNASPAGMAMMGMGALKNLQANRQQKQANAMFPSLEDPELRMLAGDYRRRRRAFQTGTANAAEMANQRGLMKQGINASFNAGGGAAGLNRLNSALSNAMLAGKQANMQGEMFYTQQYGDTVNKLAQTRLEKALLRYNQGQADAKQTKTDANRMMYGGFARVLGTGNPYDASTGTVPNMNQTEKQQDYTGVNYTG